MVTPPPQVNHACASSASLGHGVDSNPALAPARTAGQSTKKYRSMDTIRQEWFSNTRNDVLAGLVVALALIPEAIAFSIIAGVDPKVGLYASFSIAVIIALTGGRPGMISAATGAMALLRVTLVRERGL